MKISFYAFTCVGAIIFLALAMYFFLWKWDELEDEHPIALKIFTSIFIIGFFAFIGESAVLYSEQTKTVSEPIIITIENKYYSSKAGKYNHATHYYFDFSDGSIQVDSLTYKKYDIGDTIRIEKNVTYYTNPTTGETEIIETSYN